VLLNVPPKPVRLRLPILPSPVLVWTVSVPAVIDKFMVLASVGRPVLNARVPAAPA
jgi:hypothetical protein